MFTTISRPNAKPLIINGDMAVAQRSTSATGQTGNGLNSVDRMYWSISGIGTYTCAQESLTSGAAFNAGFANAMRIDCTTADASPASADYLYLQYNMEGQDLQLFKKGTANAEKFTLAFWVKSNKTGQGNVEFKDKDNSNRHAIGSYTISSADTWEHKIVNINADTTGSFDDDNAKSMNINWWLGSGDNYTGVAEGDAAWLANDADRANNDGALAINAHTDNDWAITGIQLEVGEFTSSTLPPFQHESYGDNLARCQRYYYHHASGDNVVVGMGSYYGSTSLQSAVHFPVSMRTAPTADFTMGTGYITLHRDGAADEINDLNVEKATVNACDLTADNSDGVSGTAGHATRIKTSNASTVVAFKAEL